MRITDDNGQSPLKNAGARPVTEDGRLLWVGPVQPNHSQEFLLDGVNLGNITLEKAMDAYNRPSVSNN